MIIISHRAPQIAEWIDRDCPDSSYDLRDNRIELRLTNDDLTLFHVAFAGSFIKLMKNGHWYDDTPIYRAAAAIITSNGVVTLPPMIGQGVYYTDLTRKS